MSSSVMSRTPIRMPLAAIGFGATLVLSGGTAAAAPLTVEPAAAPAAADSGPAVVADSGSASGSAYPGSILCWLLHPSPTCQL
ncbi:hypothetical protein ABZ942_11515 [Nocardia sp. NPDC046473]|uniref:hypothetical protein n=1 Tax=Nocardia sp. NPDC046473 TaxID=3155733 RepID=UPI0034061ADF